MKKQNIILAAVSLLALFSCNKEVDVIPSDTKEEARGAPDIRPTAM